MRVHSSASALKGGLRPTLHSDWNVIAIGPLRMVENAVTRTMHHGGDVLNPAEKAPVEAALRMVTADAAWQCRQDFTGVIMAGKAADLVILDKDPTRGRSLEMRPHKKNRAASVSMETEAALVSRGNPQAFASRASSRAAGRNHRQSAS